MEGDSKAGFSIFWADDGLDTGPLLLQKPCDVDINDTVDSLYTRFLLPEGIRAMVRHSIRAMYILYLEQSCVYFQNILGNKIHFA